MRLALLMFIVVLHLVCVCVCGKSEWSIEKNCSLALMSAPLGDILGHVVLWSSDFIYSPVHIIMYTPFP